MADGGEAPVPRLLALGPLKGHTNAVQSVAFSPDNILLASGSDDRTIRIWDAQTGAPIGDPLQGHDDVIGSVAFSPSSDRIVSGSSDCTVRIWNARTGSPVGGPFLGHDDAVFSVVFSPDSNRIASGSADGTIRIWDAQTGAPVGKPLQGHGGVVRSVAFSSDSSRIVSGSGDRTVRIWDVETGSSVGEPLRGHNGEVNSVAFSPDSRCITSGSDDRTIIIWDARTGDAIGEPLRGHKRWVYSVAFSPSSDRIFSGSIDSTVRIWDAHTGAPVGKPLQGHEEQVLSVAFSSDGSRIASGSWDGAVRVWDASEDVPSFDLVFCKMARVWSVAFSPDGSGIDSGSRDATICVWDASQDVPLFDSVSSKMSAQELFDCLVRHGCTDLSSAMHPDRYSSSAVARGGFGDVWRGCLNNGMVVAIKCVWLHVLLKGDWKGLKRAVRETYVWSKARHENVQELTGIIMFRGGLGMVSPWMENGHLQKYLETHPDVERYPLCIQLAAGVAYLHSIDMVHGDLKALNVLVSPEGVLKINDFDYAILSSPTLRFSKTTKAGGGTLRWMAPELLHQDGDEPSTEPNPMRTQETDIYALGMTMLETITGKLPYVEFRNDMAIYRAIDKKKPPKRPQELAQEDEKANQMWDLLLKCWDHDPTARPDAPFIMGYVRVLVL